MAFAQLKEGEKSKFELPFSKEAALDQGKLKVGPLENSNILQLNGTFGQKITLKTLLFFFKKFLLAHNQTKHPLGPSPPSEKRAKFC